MKNQNRRTVNLKKFALTTFCILFVMVLTFTLFACGKKSTNPADYPNEDTPVVNPDDNPSTNPEPSNPDNPDDPDDPGDPNNPDENNSHQPTTEEIIADIFSALANVSNLNATSTLSVSFGGRILAKTTIEYSRTAIGGEIKTTRLTLDNADAQNPYTTQESISTFDANAFAEKFPRFADTIDASKMQDVELANDNQTLSFTMTKNDAVALLNLNENDAANVASNVSVAIEISATQPKLIRIVYTSSNHNTIEIKVEYSPE